MSKYNWASFYENEPKYKVGDIVLYGIGEVGVIENAKSKPIAEVEKEQTKKWCSQQKGCCGQEGRGVRCELNNVKYKISEKWMPETEIIASGIDNVNKYIKSLKDDIDKAYEKISEAASSLGYNNDW